MIGCSPDPAWCWLATASGRIRIRPAETAAQHGTDETLRLRSTNLDLLPNNAADANASLARRSLYSPKRCRRKRDLTACLVAGTARRRRVNTEWLLRPIRPRLFRPVLGTREVEHRLQVGSARVQVHLQQSIDRFTESRLRRSLGRHQCPKRRVGLAYSEACPCLAVRPDDEAARTGPDDGLVAPWRRVKAQGAIARHWASDIGIWRCAHQICKG